MKNSSVSLLSYAISDRERDVIRALKTLIADGVDDVLEEFYRFGLDDPEIKKFFPNEAIVDHARTRQKEHWMLLFSGDFSERYLNSARTVGRVHYRIDLPFHLYISGYARAASSIVNHVARHILKGGVFGRNTGKAIDHLMVLTRVMFLDVEQVMQSYFEVQIAEQGKALDAIGEGLLGVAQGRSVSLIRSEDEGGDFPMRFDSLRDSFNKAIAALRAINEQLVPMVSTLGASSTKVSSAVEALASRTEQQGQAVAETVASVRDLSTSVDRSAVSAEKVNREAQNARNDANKAGEVVKLAVEAMNQIDGSSKKIAERISSINEIAFQTNLLALNAAVEAARAGDAGRGFAIVASEVRSLAERASATATEVDQIIQESGKSVASGVERVGLTGEALDRIIGNIVTVSDLIATVTENAQTQSSQLEGIRSALDDLDSVTQANVTMVDDTTMAAADLNTTHQQLTAALARFVSEEDSDTKGMAGRAA